MKSERFIDIVFVRHGNTSARKKSLLEGLGEAHLSQQGKQQAEAAGHKLQGLRFDLLMRGATNRMRETAKIVARHVTVDKEIFYRDMDPFTNSRAGKLYPENAGDLLTVDYHPAALRLLDFLKNSFANGGKVLCVGSGVYVVPLSVIANQIEVVDEEHYLNVLYPLFAPAPGEIHCFRYNLNTNQLEVSALTLILIS